MLLPKMSLIIRAFINSLNIWTLISAFLFLRILTFSDQNSLCLNQEPIQATIRNSPTAVLVSSLPTIIPSVAVSPCPTVDNTVKEIQIQTSVSPFTDCNPVSAPSFWSLGVAVGSDKVTLPPGIYPQTLGTHSYQWAYERYLRPRRCEKMKVLEIGLGCNMPYSQTHGSVEGRSVQLWLSFLPKSSIGIFEFDKVCATNWFKNDPHKIGRHILDARVKVTTGDQSNTEDLKAAMNVLGPQDVIIDDGGHSMMQQQTSLWYLFPLLRPGGVYILEDLSTSFVLDLFHDKPNMLTMVDYISQIISGLHSPSHAAKLDKNVYPGLLEILPLIKSVDCFREICVFQRWKDGEQDGPPNPSSLVFDQKG
jgi:hypothetical protein